MKYLIAAALILVTIFLAACSGGTSTSSTTTTPGVPQHRPLQVVSVVGPIAPFNPGGPVVEITLKNVGSEPLTGLVIVLQMDRPYQFDTPVSKDKPLPSGQSISLTQTLIGGSIGSGENYILFLTATAQSGSVFQYSELVKITAPAN